MEPQETDPRLQPVREGIQLARTAGASSDEIMVEVERCLGRYDFRRCIERMKGAKLQVYSRPDREKPKWSKVKHLYHKQRGLCNWCLLKGKDDSEARMVLLHGKHVAIDHVNPNLDGPEYIADSNLQLLHYSCNEEKSGMSIEEQSKFLHKPFTAILEVNHHGEEDSEATEA